jgi:hypothetical protein
MFQLKSSIPIGAEVEISPLSYGFTLGVKAEIGKENLGLNVLAFISNLGPKNKPKILKRWPQVFSDLAPSFKSGPKIVHNKGGKGCWGG